MSASEQLYKLADRAQRSEVNIARAKEKNQAELKAQVEDAKQSSQLRAEELKGDAEQAKANASSWWGDLQNDWNAHIAKVRENVDDRKADFDVNRSEHRAERAEGDAEAAVEFAYAALEEAEYAVLDAALARLDADELAATR
jgi:hypothetical protein